jgi:cytochrome c biogenesis protein CcmG/thiol:disulfide interchange protein DsbE
MRRLHVASLVAALVTLVIASGCGAAGLGGDEVRTVQPEGARKPAPALSVPALGGGARVTLASHHGTPVVVNFWASWCEPCQKETPTLVAFSKAHPGIDVVGIAVNDAPADSRRFARKMAIPYPVGVDEDGGVAEDFGVTGLPVTVIVDGEGRVADTFFGEIARRQLDGYAGQFGLWGGGWTIIRA